MAEARNEKQARPKHSHGILIYSPHGIRYLAKDRLVLYRGCTVGYVIPQENSQKRSGATYPIAGVICVQPGK